MDELLNECLERVIFRGESLDDVLKSHPAEAAELEPLIKTAIAVKQAAAITPRPEFRARARYEFHQEIARQKSAKHGFSLGFLPRWATALSVAMAVILASGSAVAASTSSMPDSPLYPVKLAAEQARMTVTFSDEAKAELYAEQTDNRINEIVYMANKGDVKQIAMLSERLDERMDNLAGVAMAAFGKDGQPVQVYSGSTEPATRQSAEKAMAPATAAMPPTVGTASGMGVSPNDTATLPAPAPQPLLGVAGAPEKSARTNDTAVTARSEKETKLKTILSNYALKHPAQLRAALDKVPEPARQDILRSIARTAAGYENALRSIEGP